MYYLISFLIVKETRAQKYENFRMAIPREEKEKKREGQRQTGSKTKS